MLWNARLGLVLIIIGVLANNYVYFHDVILDKHGGAIHLGLYSFIGLVVSLVLIGIGLASLVAGRPSGTSA